MAFGDTGIVGFQDIEESQLIEPLQADFPELRVVDLPSSSRISRRMTLSRVVVLPWNSMRRT